MSVSSEQPWCVLNVCVTGLATCLALLLLKQVWVHVKP